MIRGHQAGDRCESRLNAASRSARRSVPVLSVAIQTMCCLFGQGLLDKKKTRRGESNVELVSWRAAFLADLPFMKSCEDVRHGSLSSVTV